MSAPITLTSSGSICNSNDVCYDKDLISPISSSNAANAFKQPGSCGNDNGFSDDLDPVTQWYSTSLTLDGKNFTV
jgi:hypothetical protein